jgi:hypothetical protein
VTTNLVATPATAAATSNKEVLLLIPTWARGDERILQPLTDKNAAYTLIARCKLFLVDEEPAPQLSSWAHSTVSSS